ncbi:hypothetical protein CRUP_020408, partial [Coryphaenoides rupestris]
VDECSEASSRCEHVCTNTQGSFRCSCRPGYELHIDSHRCVDVTTCELRNGGCDHTCTIGAEGHLHCSCRPGWELAPDRRRCLDVDECGDFTNGGCQQVCVNYQGAFNCSCHRGYEPCVSLHVRTMECVLLLTTVTVPLGTPVWAV